ncbi:pseudouridine synthase [Neisseriaceae bacterium PsAf]|nr:pseudouridine synthase [Neisseriaceae bacterium PsAf]MCV2503165.1 rRNA pseudouridine synthase [Neisseriaceae bacterium]
MSEELVRLSKRMSELGICSRREADDYISKGWVKVNGQPATLGQKVTPQDKIELPKKLKQQQNQKITVLLHKPVGYVSAQPEKNYRSAQELIIPKNYWHQNNSQYKAIPQHIRGLAPAGRLDIDSTGLLILTQDGRIAKQIINYDSDIEKEYLVRVSGTLDPKGLALLNHGLSLDGELLLPAKVSWQNENQLKFILKQGKKRQIRRMCELVGLKVVQLKRVRIGNIRLSNLPLGKWRILDSNERF